MKKKFKLKGWVKVVLTLLIIGVSSFVYKEVGILGQDVNKNTIADALIFGGWLWILFGQFMFLSTIWEN